MAGELVACLGYGDLIREVNMGYEEGIFTKILPNGQMRGLTFPKLTAGNSALLGYLLSVKIPTNIGAGFSNGLTFKLLVTDDGSFASDLGKVVVFGITPKLITPSTSNSDMGTGASTEQTANVTLSATSGVLVMLTLALTIAQLGTPAAGALMQFRVRRVGTSASDTAIGPAMVMPPLDIFNT